MVPHLLCDILVFDGGGDGGNVCLNSYVMSMSQQPI